MTETPSNAAGKSGAETASHPLGHLIGRRVPGGTFKLADYENWLAHDALYSVPDAAPHPVMAFIAAQRGMGCSVDELFELLEADIADGPLLASTTIDIERELQTNRTYAVTGEVTGLVRKSGAALGEFDLATCTFAMSDDQDQPVGTVTNVYAIRRPA
ncbi:hypothetical protein [Streptomyces sp. NPDC046805]|uniref:hypothetical protein n=1 Tax=Streptomyces sp. NPDC046805 TaxID=3155134 RepID=UPI0033D40BFA